ncbi:peptidoglycan DD-metalloendopeptidase family protein [Desulfosporosinus sp. FKB]|uniref:peptidoglycan DD-metalloendopeptidase family protein n=1 Tax=Desulfosporosinus sp. FKB TaxID=1969835 RepID=UPI0032B7041D
MRTKIRRNFLIALTQILCLMAVALVFWNLIHRYPSQDKDVYPYLLSISPDVVKECSQEYRAGKTVSWEDLLAVRSTLSPKEAQLLTEQLKNRISFNNLSWGDIPLPAKKLVTRHREILVQFKYLTPGRYRFPVVGKTWFEDSYGADREGGKRTHEGTDLFAPEGTPIINICGGRIEQLGWNRLGGERVGVRGDDGNYYYYAHLETISFKLVKGKRIEAGETIGTMGHTGDALTTPDHLHLGIELPNGQWLNPYPFLVVWQYWDAENSVKGNNNSVLTSQISAKPSVSHIFDSQELSTQDLSYILINLKTNRLLKARNGDIQRAPASTTKLLTGLLAVQSLKETEKVRVGKEVEVEGSRLGLLPGDEISVRDLLTALFVHSANDAAAALAVKVSGTIPAFAGEMNKYASSLGCSKSNFVNPHGLPAPNHYTTASDLSKIAKAFINNPDLMKFVNEKTAAVHWADSRGRDHSIVLKNTNSLLGVYPGDQGLKTGTTTEAGQCLISYVSCTDGELLLVLLGSQQRYSDSIKLLDEGWADQRINAAIHNLSKDQRRLFSSPGIY